MKLLKVTAILGLLATAAPAQAGYVTFRNNGNVWAYWTVFFSSGGHSNVSLPPHQSVCQSQIERTDQFSGPAYDGPPVNGPRSSLAPYVRDRCE
jgi:hypothetical protein